jgi:hypothetical protein
VQFDFAGTLAVADGRYLARHGPAQAAQSVLVIETLGAPRAPSKRRRGSRIAAGASAPPTLPLARVTAVRAFAPFQGEDHAISWLKEALEDDERLDALVDEGIELLNRALHAHAVASADPHGDQLHPERAVAVRIGYGTGEEVAAGRFSAAREIDLRSTRASRRKRRSDSLRPQERVAAVLAARERLDVGETLLLRARADLNARRFREAALQLRVGVEALLAEPPSAAGDPGQDRDLELLREQRREVGELANTGLRGELSEQAERSLREMLEIGERLLRRRRVLGD